MFIGRTSELEALNECFMKEKNCICVLYGRLGIGKTEIAKVFTHNKNSFYYNCQKLSTKEQLNFLKREITSYVNRIYSGDNKMFDFNQYEAEEILSMFTQMCECITGKAEGKFTIVIDEFQNAIKSFPNFANTLVRITKDSRFAGKLNIILLSSSVKWVETDMGDDVGVAALAFTKIIKVKEFGLVDMMNMFPSMNVNDCIKVLAVFGGVPKYLRFYSEKLTLSENIFRLILGKNSLFSGEPANILKNDLRELSLYNTLLYCIASGDNKLSDIYERTGFSRAKISVYLKNLIDIDIVEKIYSYDTNDTKDTQKGIYQIKDNLIAFWYKYYFPNQSFLEFSDHKRVMSLIRDMDFSDIYRSKYVKICTDYLELLSKYDKLDFKPVSSEEWYGKDGHIDIIMKDEDDNILVGQCKWGGLFKHDDYNSLYDNINKAKLFPVKTVLFSKDGFDPDIRNLGNESDSILLISNDEL